MSTRHTPHEASPPLAGGVPPTVSRRRLDRIDEPARPLGAKRAALQLRRKRSVFTGARGKVQALRASDVTLTSQDERVAFTLRPTALGLLVERTQRQPMGTRLVQVMVFADHEIFDRWCEVEPLRFGDALLYSQLRREGHAALARTQ
ncbi:MAG: hypothetical protein AB7S86_12105 [Hydrogenophaga sp.]|uniref:hypothetical protein n=1 Tax=Hydrogenophaga sp. TaxID=1904254 RepID=UPI003D136250